MLAAAALDPYRQAELATRARFLETCAARIMGLGDELLERAALERGVQGVPYFDIGGTAIVGAQPAETVLQTIIEAAGRLAPRPAA